MGYTSVSGMFSPAASLALPGLVDRAGSAPKGPRQSAEDLEPAGRGPGPSWLIGCEACSCRVGGVLAWRPRSCSPAGNAALLKGLTRRWAAPVICSRCIEGVPGGGCSGEQTRLH